MKSSPIKWHPYEGFWRKVRLKGRPSGNWPELASDDDIWRQDPGVKKQNPAFLGGLYLLYHSVWASHPASPSPIFLLLVLEKTDLAHIAIWACYKYWMNYLKKKLWSPKQIQGITNYRQHFWKHLPFSRLPRSLQHLELLVVVRMCDSPSGSSLTCSLNVVWMPIMCQSLLSALQTE